MYLVRETMHCRPGKVRPLIDKFKAMADVMEKLGHPRPRLLTDVTGAPYWTAVVEFEVADLAGFFDMDEEEMAAAGAAEIMAGYHDLVDHGRREIWKIEG
jgi:hypothetical protein